MVDQTLKKELVQYPAEVCSELCLQQPVHISYNSQQASKDNEEQRGEEVHAAQAEINCNSTQDFEKYLSTGGELLQDAKLREVGNLEPGKQRSTAWKLA